MGLGWCREVYEDRIKHLVDDTFYEASFMQTTYLIIIIPIEDHLVNLGLLL